MAKYKSTKIPYSRTLIFLFLVASIAIYFGIIYVNNKPSIYSHPNSPNLKVYKDTQLQFEITVPKDWELEKTPPNPQSYGYLTVVVNDQGSYMDVITVNPILNEDFDGTLEEYIKTDVDEYQVYDEKKPTKFNSSDAILLKNIRLSEKETDNVQRNYYLYGEESYIPPYYYDEYIIKNEKNNYIYRIKVIRYRDNVLNETITQAISTLKLL